jgi:hypothetical protein
MNAIEKQLKIEQSELEESKLRNEELNRMNQSLDRSIQNIQAETNRTETTRKNWGWWIFGGSSKSTTTHRVLFIDFNILNKSQNTYWAIILNTYLWGINDF